MTAPVLAVAALAIALVIVVACWRYRRTAGLLAAMLVMWCFVAVFAYIHSRQQGSGGPASVPATAELAASAPAAGSGAMVGAADPTSITLLADDLGHFHVDGLVNGALVHFIVDTGATAVMLSKDDARRAGFNPDTLTYRQPITTANGEIQGADIVIYQIAVGPMRLVNVQAAVIPGDTLSSLLGMTFLSRIGSYEVNGNTMILRR